MALTPPILSLGSSLAGCRIEAEIGHGGMGVVYRAEQVRLARKVAVKVLSPTLAHDAEFRARFERESRLAASLEHPNIVPVYEAGEEGDLLFLVMRYVDGSDLTRVIAESGGVEPGRAVALIDQVAAALEAAHARGLVHRDVKPANVLLGSTAGHEHAYLSDFGITKRIASDASALTRTGMFVGTVDYIAPEQLRGEAVDGRADVYALACVLFHCLTGHVPYPREHDMAKLYAHGSAPAPRPCEEVPGLPSEFDAVIERGMAKDPAERFQSAGELARAARDALTERPAPPAIPTVPAAPPRRAARRAPIASEPVAPPPTAQTRVAPGAPPRKRRAGIALLVVAVAALAAAGALAASGALDGGGDGDTTGPVAGTATPTAERTPSREETPEPTATATATATPRPRASSTTYASYVPPSGGYEVELPSGSRWSREGEDEINGAIFRTVTRRSDGMTVLIDSTPGEAAVFSDPSRCRATTHPSIARARVCTFQGGPHEQCATGCVDYLLNVAEDGPGYAVLVGGAGPSEARAIGGRVARSLVAR